MENNVMRGNDAEMTTAGQAVMGGEGGNGVFAGDRGEGTPGGTGAAGVPGMDRFAGRDTRGAGSGMEGGMDRDDMPIEDWASVELGLPEGAADAAILEDFGRAAVDMGLTPRQARAMRTHFPSWKAQISALGLAASCRETGLLLPVWMYSLPSKMWAVPKGRTRG